MSRWGCLGEVRWGSVGLGGASKNRTCDLSIISAAPSVPRTRSRSPAPRRPPALAVSFSALARRPRVSFWSPRPSLVLGLLCRFVFCRFSSAGGVPPPGCPGAVLLPWSWRRGGRPHGRAAAAPHRRRLRCLSRQGLVGSARRTDLCEAATVSRGSRAAGAPVHRAGGPRVPGSRCGGPRSGRCAVAVRLGRGSCGSRVSRWWLPGSASAVGLRGRLVAGPVSSRAHVGARVGIARSPNLTLRMERILRLVLLAPTQTGWRSTARAVGEFHLRQRG